MINMIRKNKLVHGWGINDVDYCVVRNEEFPKINGKRQQKQVWTCPYYRDWRGVISRCYSTKFQNRRPTYKNCIVCEDWRYLSNFIKWVDSQPNKNWRNCSLDKDLFSGNLKIYSPETCVYIPRSLNNFIENSRKSRGNLLLGVCIGKGKTKRYRSGCRDPFNNNQTHLGLFHTELEAHKAWQAKKHEYACMLADLQQDERVAKALRERYAPDKDWTKT